MTHSFTLPLIAALFAGTSVVAQTADAPEAAADRGPRGALIEMLDQNGDGEITREEAEGAAEARFAAIDTDGDGTVSLGSSWPMPRPARRRWRRRWRACPNRSGWR